MRRSNFKRFNSKLGSGLATWLPFYFSFFLLVNLNHNTNVAEEVNTREFVYRSWQILTQQNSVMFEEVKSGDFFISNSQNDAFETNAGSFYSNTGVRLSYMYKTEILFPEVKECLLEKGCDLPSIRERIIQSFPNLKRGDFAPKSIRTKSEEDWINFAIENNYPQVKGLWVFDMFLMTPRTYFMYLVPIMNTSAGVFVDFRKLRATTLTSASVEEFRPSMSGVCLNRSMPSRNVDGHILSNWKVNEPYLNPAGEIIEPVFTLDMRKLEAGSCSKID